MEANFFSSKVFTHTKISLGFFNRLDGFSKGKYASLNCSITSGDDVQNIKKNINKVKKKMSLDNTKLKIINQIHSNKVVTINNNNLDKNIKADAMITQNKNISIAISTADCCPIFLFDNEASFVACIHSGWKGCYSNIVKNTLFEINKIQNNNMQINAIIGPCLGQKNFEVTESFVEKFLKSNSDFNKYFINSKNGNFLFDMRGVIKYQLLNEGLINIEDVNFDTYANKEIFYSYRRSTHEEDNPTGRMINIIGFTS